VQGARHDTRVPPRRERASRFDRSWPHRGEPSKLEVIASRPARAAERRLTEQLATWRNRTHAGRVPSDARDSAYARTPTPRIDQVRPRGPGRGPSLERPPPPRPPKDSGDRRRTPTPNRSRRNPGTSRRRPSAQECRDHRRDADADRIMIRLPPPPPPPTPTPAPTPPLPP